MRRRNGTGDDAVDVQIGGEVPVGLLEQGEREVELGLGHALPEVPIDARAHSKQEMAGGSMSSLERAGLTSTYILPQAVLGFEIHVP